MIFACDLDRTLIYSSSFLSKEPVVTRVVEYIDNVPLSYMSEHSIHLLDKLNRSIEFIPVTARSKEQYERIDLFKNTIIPSYAIVACGGIILKNGSEDELWKDLITKKMLKVLPLSELQKCCNFFFTSEEVKSFRCCNEVYLYAILKTEACNADKYNKLICLCRQNHYNVFRNGRKIYIIPDFIDKYTPIKYLLEQKNETAFMAAGDSVLDLPMLKHSVYGFIPSHGKLTNKCISNLSSDSCISFTQHPGFRAAEELLQSVIKYNKAHL